MYAMYCVIIITIIITIIIIVIIIIIIIIIITAIISITNHYYWLERENHRICNFITSKKIAQMLLDSLQGQQR